MSNLLDQFVSEECTDSLSNMLSNEIGALQNNGPQFKEYTFNRFNLYVDLMKGEARLEDDLDPDESGVLTVPLDRLLEAIKRQ